MLHDRTRSTDAVPEALARIEVWDLNSGQIAGTFTANRNSGEELSIGGTTRMECLGSSQSLLLRTAAGPALMRLRDKQVSMIAYHAFGKAVSPDGKYYAEGTGKVVNNALFWNETKDQGLSIRRTSDDAQVYKRVASDSGAKWGTTFDPLGFSRDNRLLAYSEPLLPLIGKMQAWTARFLSSGKIRGSIYPRRLRIIEAQTGKAISSYVYWSFLTKGHFRFLPNGEHMMIGRNVFAVQSRAPWLFIATLPMLILAPIWSWSVLRARKRSAKDVGEPQSPLR